MPGKLRPTAALLFAALCAAPLLAAVTPSPRLQLDADAGWKFALADPADAAAPSFQDSAWRTVDLPHDWSIEQAPSEKNATGSGGGYFPDGIGWYRRTFTAPPSWKGKQVSVAFDGVASNATIFLNGHKLGIHPYAYTAFHFDLTPDLDFTKPNVLAVRVDCSQQPSSRWYTGSGIYRHVHIVVAEPVHVAPWGVFISTPEANAASATVLLSAQIENAFAKPVDLSVTTTLLSAAGNPVAKDQSQLQIAASAQGETTRKIALPQPALWSPQTPVLYRAITEVFQSGQLVDRVESNFGVRSLAWSVDNGLLLNGQSIKLVGGSVHHDNGPLGAAAFDRAEERRVELLKAAGFNAVRTAHNPPSTAFLDACDRLGLLVLDEPFDVWTKSKAKYDYAHLFKDNWQQDVDSMVMRDRNHPSVIAWGIGNEIPEAWTPEGAPIAKQLAARVRSLDSTRPITEAFPGATYTPSTDAVMSSLDIAGYNYNLKQNQAKDHERVPQRIMMTTESVPSAAFDNWKLTQDHPYILGEFVWTAMDYLGESGIGSWSYATPEQAQLAVQVAAGMNQMMANMGADGKNPFEAMQQPQNGQPSPAAAMMKFMFPGFPWHAAYSGDMDLTGYRKPASYYRDILWNGGDRVYATVRLPEPEDKKIVAIGWAVYPSLPAWTWPGREGKEMQVEVYAGTPSVRLYLNDKLIGEMPTTAEQQRKAAFTVPYAPGTLKAVGVKAEREVAVSVLETAGNPVALRLTADRKVLEADGEDLSFITVEAVDAQGRLQPNAAPEVNFALKGPGMICAVGNGDGTSKESYQSDHRALFGGRALVVVRSSRTPGPLQLSANAPGMTTGEIAITTEWANHPAELP